MMEQNEEFKLYIKVKKEVEKELTQMKQYQKMYGDNPEYSKYFSDQIDFNLNTDYDDRSLIGDDPNDISDRSYGNSNVEGPDALHGTHVAGIIAAVRGNGKGGDGVAKNVKIMTVRAVPNGDEHDKDIALAIRYAVDNGAKIINMSFGKAYSPNQEWVYEALKYADDHDVLLVHAAGNDAQNVDKTDNYPTSKYSFQKEAFKSYLTIGASTPNAKILNASFSNYGKTKVDVFAPGEKIYNTIPDNKYKWLQGTSMAAPVVSGAAAFLASYYPKLSMQDIKEILMSTATKHDGPFSNLSVTGGVINLKCAIKKAKKMSRKK
jgi:subtilisin family serine protease